MPVAIRRIPTTVGVLLLYVETLRLNGCLAAEKGFEFEALLGSLLANVCKRRMPEEPGFSLAQGILFELASLHRDIYV
ncbi:MAG: hypothetical protein SPC25_05690, partial [Atopobiaceae bacterium]|nr:hypothetical protein [Atopobiaceae bacterium]